MAQFYLAIARDGSAPPPRLLEDRRATRRGWSLDLSPEALETMREGLRAVVQPGGTAYLSSLEHWDLMGKTGTVQNPPNPDHAWFAGIAGPKGGAPEIVVVVIVEFGESGSGVGRPLGGQDRGLLSSAEARDPRGFHPDSGGALPAGKPGTLGLAGGRGSGAGRGEVQGADGW